MARVWRAVDTTLQRTVAVKVLKLGLEDLERERFLAEARALSKLRSRHLLEVLDFGDSDGSFYFVMPFVKVVCLADVVDRRRRQGRGFTAAETAAIGLQVARALEEAHRHKIIHRDVKPQNILVGLGAAVYLTDFGIARDLESSMSLTQTGTVVGTPRYMAPEQIQGAKYDFSTDLFSLGLILFELLSGRLPGEVPGDLPATLRKRLNDVREPLTKLRPDAGALAVIVDGLLPPMAERRYRSAAELAEALLPIAGRGEALSAIQADAEQMLGTATSDDELNVSSPWTLMGQQASTASSKATPQATADESLRRLPVPPLSRPASLSGERISHRMPALHRTPYFAAATALVCCSILIWVAVARKNPARPSIRAIRVTQGFHRLRIEWAGEAKELSLVNSHGQEELYDVRDRQEWESGSLGEAGVYAASLVPPSGEPAVVPPIAYRPLEPGSLPVQVEREIDAVRVEVSLPVEAHLEATLRAESLSVERASSAAPSKQQMLRVKLDPFESASLRLVYRSRLGEEAAGTSLALPSLPAAFGKAISAASELEARAPAKTFYARLLRKVPESARLGDGAFKEIASLDAGAPLRGLLRAVPGFLESDRVPLDAKTSLYQTIMRLSDPDFFCEHHGRPVVSAVWASLPASWVSTTRARLTSPEEMTIPLEGIMSFKPKQTSLAGVDELMDDASRVDVKETSLKLERVADIGRSELMLETWALRPGQSFVVTINGRAQLEFRSRFRDYMEKGSRKETLPLFHEFDPRSLVSGANRFVVSIRAIEGGESQQAAALNGASLRLQRDGGGSGSSPGAIPDSGAASSQKTIPQPAPPGPGGRR